ncbi:hypothetical protein ACIGHG_00195 [Bacillus sp. NPDC077411]|uniref:Uncharacterized protein n=1 Tax=Bacillus bruguierae TaxID=3127667 RepID=A0ABU8FGI3_9BACI|nr:MULTISPECIES: hypothetical protein [unclassified Bacillus (in: firmicutes)]SFI13409.1 hypothetical protein SAMN04488574_101727 [Bacillus sp. 71mf]SFS74575.1 hypothetical protein SAMN04488145_10350 [Bacillus sp. 103mf]
MKMVQKEDVMKKMDQMLNTLDLLEMNVSLRVDHALKDKREFIVNKVEVMEMHMKHMETKLLNHKEKGNWVQTFQVVAVSI